MLDGARLRFCLGPIYNLLVAALFAATWLVGSITAAEPSAVDLSKLPAPVERKVDFVKEVKPILLEHCAKCHGPKQHESGLRLHNKHDFFAGGDGGATVVVGKSAESRLIHFVSGADPDTRMPPEDEGELLSADQVALLRGWIDQGAEWPDSADEDSPRGGSDHWAYKAPVKHELPSVQNPAWCKSAIDRFILARLDAEKLAPSAEAERGSLLRRVSLDLIGLPPTVEELDAFVNDSSPDAYEQAVDRLLASPHFGERWARVWLDLARYADTHGYEKDPPRVMWPYRDWVIDAFNRDLPFDEFTIDQIAGDLLPNATIDQKVATGFHRNTMINTEGGTDDEEFRVAALVDRVNTTATVWLGTTMACCQCHSHKYDPFKQKEYYGLMAFYNGTADPGRSEGPQLDVPTKVFGPAAAEVAELERQLNTTTPELAAAQAEWERDQASRVVNWQVVEQVEFASAAGASADQQADGSLLVTGERPAVDTYTITTTAVDGPITGLRLEALDDSSLGGHGPGRTDHGNFVLSEVRVTVTAPGGEPQTIDLQNATADFAQNTFTPDKTLDGDLKTGWAVAPQFGKPHEIFWEPTGDVALAAGSKLAVILDQQHGSEHTIGKLRVSITKSARPLKQSPLPAKITAALAISPDQRSEAQQTKLAAYYRSIAPSLQPARERLAQLRPVPVGKSLVMQELPKLRDTFVHVRGNFMAHGDQVTPGVPAILNPIPADQPLNRLTLARWLVSRDNPLAARVQVNRLWEHLFGRGLVLTSEDFGTQGERPTHPELLDWLAVEFMEQGWSTKKLLREMVLSNTYRQSSKVTPELLEADPANRWLARGPRARLDAELIRDQALTISGLLSHKMGGPSVMPPQPDGVWSSPYSGEKWVTSAGEDRYRRGLYTYWKRTAPYPAFMSFDAPSREFCVVRRPRTNTPLQALTVLNDPVYVEAAQALARKIINSGGSPPQDRVRYGFRACLCRTPEAAECDRLLALYQQQLARFQQDPAGAVRFSGGMLPTPAGVDPAELAAWTVVANVLLNLDELVTKG